MKAITLLKLEEVQKAEWRSIQEVEQLVVHEKNEQWTFIGYEGDLLNWLRK